MLELDIEEIQKVLPQRFPFLMIDRVIELEPGKRVVAIKNVSINEGFFSGHFPGRPVMPGVLIIEAMAQAMIMLFYDAQATAKEKMPAYYLGAVKVRFLAPVFPGDQLKIISETVKLLPEGGFASAKAYVGDKIIAEADLVFAARK